ncbi:MAG: alpha/beta fold hydrolase [Propionibacteriaceae bacterium]|nr:alpha/beta fold hydrolase [Propionibacteriaceae bacterium]
MPNPSRPRLWIAVLLAACLALPVGLASTAPADAATAKTSAKESKRVSRVKAKITWVEDPDRGGYAGTVKVPLDYDKPKKAKVTLALFKVPAADPEARIGTLFVNPGGPGGSGVDLAAAATEFLSQSVLDHFDIVGFDPRGTNGSTRVTCFSSSTSQASALSGLGEAFPSTAEQGDFIASSENLARACSKYGKSLASSMSTAEVARDMEVLRRAVGDSKLNYLGFSYGSYLGEVYASIFPDRFRTIAIDGVLNPVSWAGTKVTSSIPATTRIKSGDGSWAALVAGLAACADAGPEYCPLDDPQADFDAVAASLKAETLRIGDGDDAFVYSYQDFIADSLSLLYYPEGMDYLAQIIAALEQILGTGSDTDVSTAGDRVSSLVRAFHKVAALEDPGYDNGLEAYSGVLCTDAYQPSDASAWVSAAAKSAIRAPHFGQIWGWADVQCATDYWKARDEDAYHGTYSRSTAAQVLVVGNYHDPATNYNGAVEANTLMPNSVLLRSDSWGHTAYGTSDCVTDRVDSYLITGKVPSGTSTTVCTGDVRPFMTDLGTGVGEGTGNTRVEVPSRVGLPPISIPWLPREG